MIYQCLRFSFIPCILLYSAGYAYICCSFCLPRFSIPELPPFVFSLLPLFQVLNCFLHLFDSFFFLAFLDFLRDSLISPNFLFVFSLISTTEFLICWTEHCHRQKCKENAEKVASDFFAVLNQRNPNFPLMYGLSNWWSHFRPDHLTLDRLEKWLNDRWTYFAKPLHDTI